MDLRKVKPSTKDFSGFVPIKAIGGNESTVSVAGVLYKLHVFYNTGQHTLNIIDPGTIGLVEYLVVGGGGGGGMDMGGGGGGGAVMTGTYKVVPGETIPVTVGRGGYGGPGGSEARVDMSATNPASHQFTYGATAGQASRLGSIFAPGGGRGGSSYFGYTPDNGYGGDGASGGGASGYSDGGTGRAGSGIAGLGYNGGTCSGQYYSGGGGGAGAAGTNAPSQPNGGIGKYSDILGTGYYWGGGGGGAAYSSGSGGNGGNGGGGGGAVGTSYGGAGLNAGQPGLGGSNNAQTNTRGGHAGVNTGGGGGGGSHYNATNSGGEGGSGIVVVRYPIEYGSLPGLSQDSPATSGIQLLTLGMPSGNYWIKPTGYTGAAERLWVDNTNQGGGWVLIGKGRHATPDNSGWFGTDDAISTSGLISDNAFSAGVSKVSASFVNYLMNGTASGWQSGNSNNYMIANRINNATDGYGGVGDSFSLKVTNTSTFTWVNQFGRAVTSDSAASTGTGSITRYSGSWLSGTNSGSSTTFIDNDFGSSNGAGRLFTWHWSSHGVYHGWSSGSTTTAGFQNGTEGHAIQFVQLWAK